MAMRSSLTTLRSSRFQLEATTTAWTPVSSSASLFDFSSESSIGSATVKNSLKSLILRTKCPRRSPTGLLQDWADSGHKVTISELRFISRRLLQSKRYHHALEIMKWMEAQKGFQISAGDHVMMLELIIKVHGLTEGEEYFMQIRSTAARKAACFPLLHGYVKERIIEKAEALMVKLNELGLLVNPHPFNEIMKLYIATSQCEKVPLVIKQMNQNKTPKNVLSYNLWMNACAEVSGVESMEKVYREMIGDKKVEVGWSTLSTLANVYIKAGFLQKAIFILKNAEKKLNTSNRFGYFFLITLYASLKNKEGVLRLWEACKSIGGRITCVNYMCILSCLVKLGELGEAERVLEEWESNCQKYDVRVSNVLLAAYMRNGLMDKAHSLHIHTLGKGGCPNYKTWEILMEGWVKSQNMEKAIDAMKKAFSMMKHCEWRPPQTVVMSIAEFYLKHGKFEDACQFLRIIHRFGLASLPLYKLLLRMHVNDQRPALDIFRMMEKDKIVMDDETSALFHIHVSKSSALD